MKKVLVLCLLLGACGTTNPLIPQVVVKEVQVPTPVRCHPVLGPEPDYPDSDANLKSSPDTFTLVQRLLAGRILRIARDQVKTAALTACAG